MAKAAARRLAPACDRRRCRRASRSARRGTAAKSTIASSPATYAALRALSLAMKLDVVLFGRITSGPFFALLVKDRAAEPGARPEPRVSGLSRTIGRDEDPVLARSTRRCPGTTGGSVHVDGRRRGARGARTRRARARDAAARSASPDRRRRALDADVAAASRARQLRWMRTGAVRRIVARARSRDVVIERYYNFGGEAIFAARRGARRRRVLEVNAPVVDYAGSTKALHRSRPDRRTDAALAGTASAARRPHRHAERGDPAAADAVAKDRPRSSGARTPTGSGPASRATAPFARPGGDGRDLRRRFRSWHGAINLVRAVRELRARGRSDIGAVFVGDGPELRRGAGRSRGSPRHRHSPARSPHDAMPACLAAADIGVAPFEFGAHRPLSLGFYWSPLKIFEYMAAGLPVVAPAIDRDSGACRAHSREGCSTTPRNPARSPTALAPLADPDVRAHAGRGRARARACASSAGRPTAPRWTRHSTPGDVEIRIQHSAFTCSILHSPTDCVPARLRRQRLEHVRAGDAACGARGHGVIVVQPRPGEPEAKPRAGRTKASGRRVRRSRRRPCLFVRNYFKNERLYPRLADRLSDDRSRARASSSCTVSTCSRRSPSIEAAHRHEYPGRLHGARLLAGLLLVGSHSHRARRRRCAPGVRRRMMTRCIRPRGGALWPLALPMIPYMRANLARKRTGLARADAIVAVSSTIAADLRARAPELAATRIEIIPNPVDVDGTACDARPRPRRLCRSRTRSTSASSRRTKAHRTSWTSSSARTSTGRSSSSAMDRSARGIEARARHRAGDIRFVGWVDRASDRGAGWRMRRCWSSRPAARNRSAACCSRLARWACRSRP